jgi:hypothetical protein
MWCRRSWKSSTGGGLRETTNCCLAEVVSIILSGDLRRITNQSRSLVTLSCCWLMGLRNWKSNYQLMMLFPPVRFKERRCNSFHFKMCQYSRMDSSVWLIYLIGYWWPLPRRDPPPVVIYSYSCLAFETPIWRITVLSTMLARMNIKTLIFNVANSLTMLAFQDLLLNWSKWMWNFCNNLALWNWIDLV